MSQEEQEVSQGGQPRPHQRGPGQKEEESHQSEGEGYRGQGNVSSLLFGTFHEPVLEFGTFHELFIFNV